MDTEMIRIKNTTGEKKVASTRAGKRRKKGFLI